MSTTELKIAKWKGPVEIYKEYKNAWGGFPFIWNSIWNKFIKQVVEDKFDSKAQQRMFFARGKKSKKWRE